MAGEFQMATATVAGCALLLLLLLLVALRMATRLARIERLLEEGGAGSAGEPVVRDEPAHSSEAQRREFEEFLAEDGSRRAMPKKEQFAAYRSWRKARGLTWGSS